MLEDVNLLITKRHEYISDVISTTRDKFIAGLKSVYKDAQKVNRSRRFLLRDFQNQLKTIASWTTEKQMQEMQRFDEVVNQYTRMVYNVHMCNIKMFHAQVTPPTLETYPICDFTMHCYLHMAREIWRKPHLFYDKIEKQDYNKNIRDIEKIVANSIKHCLRNLVPMSSVIEDELCDYDSVEDDTSEHDLVMQESNRDLADEPPSEKNAADDKLEIASIVSSASSSSASSSSSSASSSSSSSSSSSDDSVSSSSSTSESNSDASHKNNHRKHKKVIYVNTDTDSSASEYKTPSPKNQSKRPTGTALEAYKSYANLNQVQLLMNRKKMKRPDMF